MENAKIRLSEQFLALALECEQEILTVRELISALGVRGHGFVALMFSIPFVTPIPLPGLSIIFGIFVFIGGLGISLGFKLWLPEWIMKKSLPGHMLSKAFRGSSTLLRKIETILRPRLFMISESVAIRICAGFLIALSGFILALPLPPGTNFPPAAVCVLLSLGVLERDGIFLIAGFVTFLLNIAVIVGLLAYARPWLMQWLA